MKVYLVGLDEEKPIVVGKVKVYLVWFDSLGAKSSCVRVETPKLNVLIDPGAAAMQPSYPLPDSLKLKYLNDAFKNIVLHAKKSNVIVISHYHHDHYVNPKLYPQVYHDKMLLVKNPNMWINRSQWFRAREFILDLINVLKCPIDFNELLIEPKRRRFKDPVEKLKIALSKDFGDYQPRRLELLEKGKLWFKSMVDMWTSRHWVREFKCDHVNVRFVDGKTLEVNGVKLKFSKPSFHGIEYERTGWVFSTVIEYGKVKFMHSSDLQGPQIEDYAAMIVKENPNVLVVDGPPTYLLGYMMNLTNFKRALDNMVYIIENLSRVELIIYDHHLLRAKSYREKVRSVYEAAKRSDVKVLTAAEWYGEKPLIDRIA